MAKLTLTRRHFSPTLIGVLAGIFILVITFVMLLSYLLAQRTQEQLLSNQAVNDQSPISPTKRQIRSLTLENIAGLNGETYEIGLDGTVKIYDAQGVLIKSKLQGFGRINSLFSDITRRFSACEPDPPAVPNAYKLTIYTNLGVCVIYIPIASGGADQALVDSIDDLVEDTFAPTPTLAPTLTPYPGYVSPTPGQAINNPSATPGPTPLGGGPAPSPLPNYLTDPPFKCSDYQASRPFAISNVICGLAE